MIRSKRILASAVLILAVSIVPLTFSYNPGFLNAVRSTLLGSQAPTAGAGAGTDSTASVFVDPAKVIKDYVNNPGYQVGNKFVLHVNISGVSDLFSWQINLTWNKAVLNVSKIIAGEFLARAGPTAYTSSSPEPYGLGFVINATDNSKSYSSMAESILGGVPGISGGGRLVSVEFLIVGYGCSNVTISLGGSLATTLLNSTGQVLSFTATDGWFSNRLFGDLNSDRAVNILDVGKVNAYWWPTPPYPVTYRPYDANDDGAINILDKGIVNANWGRSV